MYMRVKVQLLLGLNLRKTSGIAMYVQYDCLYRVQYDTV